MIIREDWIWILNIVVYPRHLKNIFLDDFLGHNVDNWIGPKKYIFKSGIKKRRLDVFFEIEEKIMSASTIDKSEF